MTDITSTPADIAAVAAAFKDAQESCDTNELGQRIDLDPSYLLATAIAKARMEGVEAERERCAVICDDWEQKCVQISLGTSSPKDIQKYCDKAVTADKISQAIRKGQP